MPRSDAAVELSVEIAARPATVFRCLTESGLLSQWLAARASIEPRLGGSVRIDFERFATVVVGEVVELVKDERIAFTWGVAGGPQAATMPAGSTRVTITLTAQGDSTRLTLRHAGLPTDDSCRDHEFGWKAYLSQLGQTVWRLRHAEGSDGVVDAWFAAWAEPDPAMRCGLLESSFATSGTFRDVHAEVAGRDALNAHIGVCQRFFPGVRMVRDGAPSAMRESLLVRWNAVTPDGTRVMSGTNHFRLAASGRITAVEGFFAA
jgi:uncharacterized protein YndB with AHSA1/START domain